MGKFQLRRPDGTPVLIGGAQPRNRMVRLTAQTYRQITLLATASGLSKGRVLEQCVSYAIDHMEEDPDDGADIDAEEEKGVYIDAAD